MESFVISLGQMSCDREHVKVNEGKIIRWMEDSAENGSSLLVLPELSLTGYRTFGREEKGALSERVNDSILHISSASAELGVDVLLGHPVFEKGDIYIASSYIANGGVIASHKKTNLCNYAHYEEHKHFMPGDEVTCAASSKAAFGIIICEDSWHPINAIIAAQLGAEIMLNPSAASVINGGDRGACLDNWARLSIGTAFSTTSFFVLCNQAGPTPDGHFMGGSHIVGPDGKFLLKPASTEETLIHFPLEAGQLSEIRSRRPLIANERMEIYSKYCASR